MATFEYVAQRFGQVESTAGQALRNDFVENAMVIARLQLSPAGLLTPALVAAVYGDMWLQHNKVQDNLRRTQTNLTWLQKSSRSNVLLSQAVTQWSQIANEQGAVVTEISAGQARLAGGRWGGDSRDHHLGHSADLQDKGATFAQSLQRIVQGCEMSNHLVARLMTKAGLVATTALTQGQSATVGPSAFSGQPRNWRLRTMVTVTETLSNEFVRLRAKTDWADAEARIARIFDDHADTLKQLLPGTGGGPLMHHMV